VKYSINTEKKILPPQALPLIMFFCMVALRYMSIAMILLIKKVICKFLPIRSMDKYARLMQKLEIINMEFFKV
jgi:hypothetical protein